MAKLIVRETGRIVRWHHRPHQIMGRWRLVSLAYNALGSSAASALVLSRRPVSMRRAARPAAQPSAAHALIVRREQNNKYM